MKRRIIFTAYLDYDLDDYDDWNPKSFEEVENSDYDSVERPLNRLEDEGWVITSKTIENID